MSAPARLADWCLELEGSTRAVGLLRIALALLVWSRWAQEVAFFAAEDALHVVLACWFFPVTLLMLVGLYTRLAVAMTGAILAIMYVVFGIALGHTPWAHHHTYLLMFSTVLLAFTPCERSYSLDRWRALRGAAREGRAPPAESGRLWGQRLIGLQLSALYFWTAVDKTDWAFLSGQRLEQTLFWVHSNRPLFDLLAQPRLVVAASIAVVLVEYALAVAIHLRRLQPVALPVGLALHAAFYLLLPVNTYSATMMCLYLAVLDPQRVHGFIERMHGGPARAAA